MWTSSLPGAAKQHRVLLSTSVRTVAPSYSRKVSSRAASEAPTVAQSHPLLAWVQEQSGKVAPSLTIGQSAAAGQGLLTSEALEKGTDVVVLPAACQLTYDHPAPGSTPLGLPTSPALLKLIEQVPESFWGMRLALRVLEQRAQTTTSPFWTYISHLPPTVEGLPMFFSPDAIKALWYPPLQSELAKRGRFMAKFSQESLGPALAAEDSPFNGVKIDLSGLGWALAVVTSRAFATRGPRKPRAMLPVIDTCNHSFDPNCDLRKDDDGSMVLFTCKPVKPGEQLLLSYGKLDNHTLLLDYGFLVHDNPYDNIAVLFDVDAIKKSAAAVASQSLEPQTWQKQRLMDLKLLGQGGKPACAMGRGTSAGPLTAGVDERLISGMEVLCAPDATSLKASSKLKPAVEAAGLALAQLYIEATFKGLELDAVQDQVMLAKPDLAADVRMATQLRLCKLVMLEQAYEALGAAVARAGKRAACEGADSATVFRAAMAKL